VLTWTRSSAAVCLSICLAGCLPAASLSDPDPAAAAPPSGAGGTALLVEPDDGSDQVLSIIRNARRSVHLEMYLLTDDDAITALIASRQSGLDVQVILEPHPFQSDGANQSAYDRLTAAGAGVTWASARFALTHAKMLVVDSQRACVMTLNWTHAGLDGNREYAVVDDDATDVANAEAIFTDDRVGTPAPAPTGRLLVSPANSREGLAALIAGARRSLVMEMEELSDPDLVAALTAAVGHGVAVTMVLPGTDRSASTDAAAQTLAAGGVSVRALATPDVHAKAMVADGTRLYVGSINLTAASLDDNREFGVVIDDSAAAARMASTIAGDWSRAGEL
jgi:cardiolipin synthase